MWVGGGWAGCPTPDGTWLGASIHSLFGALTERKKGYAILGALPVLSCWARLRLLSSTQSIRPAPCLRLLRLLTYLLSYICPAPPPAPLL